MILQKSNNLNKERILNYLSNQNLMTVLMWEDDNYLRLKLSPTPSKEFFDEFKEKFQGITIKQYTGEDGCIVEITRPVFDLIIERNIDRFPTPNGFLCNLVHNKNRNKSGEVVACFKYSEDFPYGLLLANKLLTYLNENTSEVLHEEYEEIITTRI